MPRKSPSSPPLSKSRSAERQELDIQLPIVLTLALALAAIIYAALFPLRESTVGTLLYERGFTQYAVILLACTVLTFTILKFFKLQGEAQALRRFGIPRDIPLEEPADPQLTRVQHNLSLSKHSIAIRCSRILSAYMYSGSRKAAAELALDDSAFYQAATESSYAFPRILIWAIPLLGFIGTVIGISGAVAGFSGFLEQAGDVDQIREGIGRVTTGLAVAFDTTLLALLLSVLVMIPLVMVERFESRLLLGMDVYINDKLLPRFKDTSDNLDETALQTVVDRAFTEHLPAPEVLIQPAEEYAKQAAATLAEGFLSEVGKIQGMTTALMEQLGELSQSASRDRKVFQNALKQQQQASEAAFTELLGELQTTNRQLAEELKTGNAAVAQGLFDQAEKLSYQLEQAAAALQGRIANLERYSAQVSEIAQLQQSLEQTLQSLEKSAQLEQVLLSVQDNLAQLKPALEQLSKPRRITFVEQED